MNDDFKFQPNDITSWTILPSTVISKAWLSEDFKKDLLENPIPVIESNSKKWPKKLSTVVVEDKLDLRHFIIPSQSKGEKFIGNLLETLKKETDNDKTLKWSLPAEVINKALTDSLYRKKLISNPKNVLSEEGYDIPESRVVIFENSESTHHLILPRNPLNNEQINLRELNERLIGNLRNGGTGQCCASGTCS